MEVAWTVYETAVRALPPGVLRPGEACPRAALLRGSAPLVRHSACRRQAAVHGLGPADAKVQANTMKTMLRYIMLEILIIFMSSIVVHQGVPFGNQRSK